MVYQWNILPIGWFFVFVVVFCCASFLEGGVRMSLSNTAARYLSFSLCACHRSRDEVGTDKLRWCEVKTPHLQVTHPRNWKLFHYIPHGLNQYLVFSKFQPPLAWIVWNESSYVPTKPGSMFGFGGFAGSHRTRGPKQKRSFPRIQKLFTLREN